MTNIEQKVFDFENMSELQGTVFAEIVDVLRAIAFSQDVSTLNYSSARDGAIKYFGEDHVNSVMLRATEIANDMPLIDEEE